MARALGLTNGKTKRCDVGRAYDELGVVRQGKEAVGVYMQEILSKCVNEGERSEVRGDEEGEEVNGGNELLNEDVTSKEVKQALDTLKWKAAPGSYSDRLTAEMVCSGVLVDFWCSLFSWCWKNGMQRSREGLEKEEGAEIS